MKAPFRVMALLALLGCQQDVDVTLLDRVAMREVVRLEFELRDVSSGELELIERDVRGLELPVEYQVLLGASGGDKNLTVRAFGPDGARVGEGTVVMSDEATAVEMYIEPDEFGVNTTIAASQQLAADPEFAGRQVAVADDGSFMIGWEHLRDEVREARARIFDPSTTPRINGAAFSTAEYTLAQYAEKDNHVSLVSGKTGYLAVWEADANGARRVDGRVYKYDDGSRLRPFPESPLAQGTGELGHPAVFATAERYGVAWLVRNSMETDGSLRVRMIDETGDPVEPGTTDAVSVSTATSGKQAFPDAVGLVGGGFVVAWQQNDGVGEATARARVFTDGAAPVSTDIALGSQDRLERTQTPKLAALPGGGFVATWIHDSFDGRLVRMRTFDAQGEASSEATVVALTTDSGHSVVAASPDGTIAVVWSDGNGNEQDYDVFVRYYRDGEAVGDAITVNTLTDGDQFAPAVAALPDGGFIVVWTDRSAAPPDIAAEGVMARAIYPPE